MIQFDKKISIDGVAVILASITLVVWLTSLNNSVASLSKQVEAHESAIGQMRQTEELLQQNLAVLTAIQNFQSNNKPTTTVIK